VRGFRVALSGCIACTKPVAIGGTDRTAGARRMITVSAPRKDGSSLSSAVEIARGAVGFESVPEAKRWLTEVRPALRAELVFRPAEEEWTFGAHRGYALELLAGRIYNRCTGEIVLSKPPSQGIADRPPPGREHEDPACAVRAAAPAGSAPPRTSTDGTDNGGGG